MSEINFQSPEMQALTSKHFTEDIAVGLYASYIQSRDAYFAEPYKYKEAAEEQAIISNLARAEAPLFPIYDGPMLSEDHGRIYFLIKVNPVENAEIKVPSPMFGVVDSMDVICRTNDNGDIEEVSTPYTQEQAELVVRHVVELDAIGCLLSNLGTSSASILLP